MSTDAQLSLRKRITEDFREKILSGELKPGSLLPPTSELVRFYGTGVPNIQRAMTELVREGLIYRRTRLGTVVSDRRNELRNIIIYNYTPPGETSSAYSRLMMQFLAIETERRGLTARQIATHRADGDVPTLRRLIDRGEAQGVLIIGRQPPQSVRNLPVPLLFSSDAALQIHLATDWVRQGMRALKEKGCRSVGLISTVGEPPHDRGIYTAMAEAAREFGVEIRSEWMFCRAAGYKLEYEGSIERYGYYQSERFCRLNDRPDGVIVFPDEIGCTFFMALFRNRLAVPDDLKIALHHNREISLPIPVECSLLQASIASAAQRIMDVLQARFAGDNKEFPPLEHEIVHHQPTEVLF